MSLSRPQNFLVALLLIAGNTHLSAFDITVELPSGSTVYLNAERLYVNPIDYEVSIDTTVNIPKEQLLVIEDPSILDVMSQSLQKTWGLQNCKIELKDPVIGTLSPGLAISLMDFREKPVFPPLHLGVGCSVVNAGALSLERTFAFVEDTKIFQNGVVVYDFNGKCEEKTPDSGAGSCLISSGTLALEDNPMFVGDTKIFQDALAVDASNGQCEEKTPLEVQDSKQDDAHENPSIFNLSFSIAGSDIGGKWRLTPYEILFLRKQSDSGKKRNTEDDIEMLALLVAPEKCDLYQKKYSHPDFSSVTSAPNVLTCCLDSTLMLRSPLGTFFFNGDGQLTHSFGTGQRSSTYDYCDGKLARIHYPDYLDLSFEYEDGKVIGTNGLPNSIHLEYDDEHHLCRIYDDQGSYLRMTYEDNDIDKIIDDSGVILFDDKDNSQDQKVADPAQEKISLVFNAFGDIFYYKNTQNIWKFSFRELECED